MLAVLPLSFASFLEENHVSLGTTLLFTAILVGLIVSLALEEKIHAKKSFLVACFAVLSLLLGAWLLPLPYGPYEIGGQSIDLPVYIPSIDWNVIAIILGSGLFVDVTSKSGLFTWIAIRLTKLSAGDPLRLLWYYGMMTVVFSAVLNNVTAMIIVGSLTAVSLGKLERKEKLLGFLLIEGLLTNVGGLLTLISSVPNIIVGTTAQISFLSFFVRALPFVLVASALTIWLGARVFAIQGNRGEAEREKARELVRGFDENDGIASKGFFWFSTCMLGCFILVIATASILPLVRDLGLGFVTLAFATILLARYKSEVDTFYKTVDWDLLGFFAGLFVVIHVMEHAGVLGLIGSGLEAIIGLGPTLGTGSILVSAAAFSSVTDNIPLAAMLAKIIAAIPLDGAVRAPTDPLWWSVIFGANLGGNLTPIGSASTLVAVTIMHRHGLGLSFAGFVRKALPFALLQIGIATLYVLFVLGHFA